MRTDAVTIDASALAKLILDEPDSAEFAEWYRQLRTAGVRAESSPLLQFELGNLLQREFPRDERNGKILEAALDGVDAPPIAPPSPLRFAPPLTYYDASYLAAARASGALATYDDRMGRLAAKEGLVVWGAGNVRTATRPGFVGWIRQQRKGIPGDGARDEWSYLQALAWTDGLGNDRQSVVGLLDESFARFAT